MLFSQLANSVLKGELFVLLASGKANKNHLSGGLGWRAKAVSSGLKE